MESEERNAGRKDPIGSWGPRATWHVRAELGCEVIEKDVYFPAVLKIVRLFPLKAQGFKRHNWVALAQSIWPLAQAKPR